ncbi:MAG: HdeD family acid-resistance protein [Methylovirgula sp.]|uniref:HdeD family acid-resistance protein n=1 Tax=Methylovirgula sp. TaxID=1978224 RepID=UPI0030764675
MANTAGPVRALAERALFSSLADNWWLFLLRGFVAIAFGVLAFRWPGLTLLTLTYLWGAYALLDGIIALSAAIFGPGDAGPRWWLALAGFCGVLSAFIAFFWPGMTTLILLMFIAGWAIAVGGLQIWGAFELRRILGDAWLLSLSGILSLAFGILMIAQPGAGALSLVWIIGWYAILVGCSFIAFALRLKQYQRPA